MSPAETPSTLTIDPVTIDDVAIVTDSVRLFDYLATGPAITLLTIGERRVHPVSVGALNAYRRLFGVGYFLRRHSPTVARSRYAWHALTAHLGFTYLDA